MPQRRAKGALKVLRGEVSPEMAEYFLRYRRTRSLRKDAALEMILREHQRFYDQVLEKLTNVVDLAKRNK